jgi:hypothetical protein
VKIAGGVNHSLVSPIDGSCSAIVYSSKRRRRPLRATPW